MVSQESISKIEGGADPTLGVSKLSDTGHPN